MKKLTVALLSGGISSEREVSLNSGRQVLAKVQHMLGRLGLRIHRDKTRVVQAKKGFDFLGVHFRLCRTSRKTAKRKWFCNIWPTDRSMKRIRQRLREITGRRYPLSLEELIEKLNPVIRGWNNYHTAVNPDGKRLRRLNGFIRERIRTFLKRKYDDRSRGSWRVHNNLLVRLGLHQFG